jgi:hypothetical protein
LRKDPLPRVDAVPVTFEIELRVIPTDKALIEIQPIKETVEVGALELEAMLTFQACHLV